MREEIQRRQNDEDSLNRLAAQRFLYSQAKSIENLRLVSILIVVIVLATGLVWGNNLFSQYAILFVVLTWILDQGVLVRRVSDRKKEAATIQEAFDCFVLNLPWPRHYSVANPTKDRVESLAQEAKRKGTEFTDLMNWYEVEEIPNEVHAAQLYCQRINCYWEERLRQAWVRFVACVVCVILILGVVACVVFEASLFDIVLGFVVGIRLIALLWTERVEQASARERMKNLHAYISELGESDGQICGCDVRLIQAVIFEHRRVCPTVPDWFYRCKKDSYES